MDKNKELLIFLDQKFGIGEYNSEVDSESEYLKRMQLILSKRIEDFIRFRLDDLLQILYRIDINQVETDKAFELGEVSKISFKLSELIIVRQLQKIEYSRKFNQEN